MNGSQEAAWLRTIATLAIVAGVFALSLGSSAQAQSQTTMPAAREAAAKPFVMRPGVVVDPTRGAVYMMNPQGGIDAVDIASGKLLWTTKAAAKPLTMFRDQLIAQAETSRGSHSLPIAILDPAQGRRLAEISIPISDPLSPAIDNGRGFSSTVTAQPDGSVVLVRWEVASQRITGISHPVVVTRYSGAATIDPATRKVSEITAAEAAKRTASSPAIQPRLTGHEGLLFAPVKADGAFVSIQVGPATAGQPAILKRWSLATAEPLPDTDLGSGFVAYSIAADGSDIAVVRSGGSWGGATNSPGFVWTIYATTSGNRVGELKVAGSATPFFVWHSLIVRESAPFNQIVNGAAVEEPLQLIAAGLDTGASRWKRALRDTVYRGAPIPHP